MVASLEQALREGESHTTEFKKSLGELREAAQTVVAFANAHGGDVFIGVANDRWVGGVDVGATTLEGLAADLDRLIYPYAPLAIDPLTAENGRTVVRVSAVADTPPVVGVYLYSSQPLPLDARVSTRHLHAYRRVGRTNRMVPDFMWLRPQARSDPLMLIDHSSFTRGELVPRHLEGVAWLADGSGLAHGLRFRLDPELAPPQESCQILPGSDGPRSAPYRFDLHEPTEPVDGLWVVVEYQDDWGCLWESRRYLRLEHRNVQPTATMSRRIVELPPKRGTA